MQLSVLEMLFTSELPTFEENEEVNKSVEKTNNDEKVEEKSDLSKEQEKNLQIVQVKLKKAKKDHQVIKQIQQKPQK